MELLARQSSYEHLAAEVQPFLDDAFRLVLRRLGEPEKAFLWLEQMKARGLLDWIAQSSDALVLPSGANAELTEQARHLEKEQASANHGTLSGRRKWSKLTRGLEEVWNALANLPDSAAYATLRMGRPVTWEQWRATLARESSLPQADGRTVVSVHFAWPFRPADPISLFVCRPEWDKPRYVEITNLSEQLIAFADNCFATPDRAAIRSFLRSTGDESGWSRRFAKLLHALEEWTASGEIIVLIPHGPLHSLPLHALHVEGMPLSERNPVVYGPSAAILQFCWERKAARNQGGRLESAAVFGCSAATEGLPPLHRAREEARFVADLFQTRALLDDEVSLKAFLNVAGEARFVHFVGHALEDASGWSSGLQIGLGQQVTAKDLFQNPLNADIVTLSGCRTARSRWRQGDETLGLTPALLFAGAASVVSSQWEVREDSAEAFMRNFYIRLRTNSASCKAVAMQEAIAQTKKIYPALSDWAAFLLYGDWK